MSTGRLDGRVAVVTGAGQGLGEAVARLLAARGAAVVVTDVNVRTSAAVADGIRADGGTADAIALDVSREDQWADAVAHVSRLHGKADILVNNAGIIEFAPITGMSAEMFDRTMRVNVRGTFLGCKYILPLMKNGGGSIVNVSSMAGLIAHMPGTAAYSTSKGAVRMLTRAVAMEYLEHGIRVNAVLPGSMDTPIAHDALRDPEQRKLTLGRTPIDRPAEPVEVARTIAFLVSDESSYMTGSDLVVDGGWTAC